MEVGFSETMQTPSEIEFHHIIDIFGKDPKMNKKRMPEKEELKDLCHFCSAFFQFECPFLLGWLNKVLIFSPRNYLDISSILHSGDAFYFHYPGKNTKVS